MRVISDLEKEYLRRAIKLANKSKRPFGAVLVNEKEEIVMETHDVRDEIFDPTAHPELFLISEYSKINKKIDLTGYSLYTSTEPCAMCSGAIRSARISKVVFSTSQSILRKHSGGKTKINSLDILKYSKGKVIIKGPFLLNESIELLEKYYSNKNR